MLPSTIMNAIILVIGDELTRGKKADGNGPWLARALTSLGHDVLAIRSVPDRRERLACDLSRAIEDVGPGWVLCTGGLGPTKDDLTKEIVAELLDRPLVHDEKVWEAVRARFAARERRPTESNRSQALVPEGAIVLPNPVGTAPGLLLSQEGAHVCLMPGVPHEMRRIWTDSLLPLMRSAEGALPSATAILRTTGIPESALADLLGTVPEAEGLAYLPTALGVDLHVTVDRGTLLERQAELTRRCRVLEALIGPVLWGRNEEDLSAVVGQLLVERGLQVSTAESCTAGLLAGRLTDVAGSSAWVDRGFVVYTNEAKVELLGVSPEVLARHGAVSAPVAAAMAEGALARSRSGVVLALTGIAGPGGATVDKPVGLVFLALSDDQGTVVQRRVFGSDRERNRQRSVQAALELLRRRLLDLPLPDLVS